MSYPLKKILNSSVLRNQIFQSVRDIHKQIYPNDLLCCNWYDVGCFPEKLIKFDYIDRFKAIFDHIHSSSKNEESNDALIQSFRCVYSSALVIASNVGNLELIEYVLTRQPQYGNDTLYHTMFRDSIANGYLNMMKYLHDKGIDSVFKNNALDEAASHGHLSIVEFLHFNRTEGCTKNAFIYSAFKGHLEIVKFLNANRSEESSPDAMNYAAQKGFLDVVLFLHENSISGCTFEALDGAASGGHLSIVKFLHYNRTEGCTKEAINRASKNGHNDVVLFLLENRTEGFTSKAIEKAAYHGHLDLLKLLLNHNPNNKYLSTNIYCALIHQPKDRMAKGTSGIDYSQSILDMVKYFHDNGIGRSSYMAMNMAAKYEFFEVLKFLHFNRDEGCTDEALSNAVISGNMDIIQFLVENGMECSPNVLSIAAKYKQIEAFKYLHYKRSDLTCKAKSMDTFAGHPNVETLEWLWNNRTEKFTSEAFHFAIMENRFANIKWLKEKQVEIYPEALTDSFFYCDIVTIEYLYESGVPFSSANDLILTYSILQNSIPKIQFLLSKNVECRYKSMFYAMARNNLTMIKYLLASGIPTNTMSGSSQFQLYPEKIEFIKQFKL
ncbi:hypothetical protein PPL_06882 [Heterostelium album PN500]|uniref:Ankyrin repeat protein n=1 Tax=Heterostelium pallidum (strain ATCC 26659 / Pp 5 / PN500) TaxID=670386 RepID=D3BDS9_HETP5|nr:hypothetical protein PPL_06882 [Heterostelium album PN500]EFA80060.1 hypothetical protein PPL_06882 [Heterostelium album PN500]|eukprot:XP_020432180.1 hypothetical protein PPL_06882 [Heterostelium album PN500]